MSISPIERIIIRYGTFTAKNLEEPKILEFSRPDFERTGILLQSGLQLADCILPIKVPGLEKRMDIGKITNQQSNVIYTPKHPEVGNILKRTQFDLDVIPGIADDEYAPKIENMHEHILPTNSPFNLHRGDIIIARAYNEQIQNIAGTYVEIYQIFRDGFSSKL